MMQKKTFPMLKNNQTSLRIKPEKIPKLDMRQYNGLSLQSSNFTITKPKPNHLPKPCNPNRVRELEETSFKFPLLCIGVIQ
jgi:hypothetical protein